MTIPKIVIAPDPLLLKPTKPTGNVDSQIRKIMDEMLESMYRERGIGLSANQIGLSKSIVVLDLQEEDPGHKIYPLFMSDPVIKSFDGELVEEEEGCLSIPGETVAVQRRSSISVEYTDYRNKHCHLVAHGLLARAIQHEIDHLRGRTLLWYLSPLRREVIIRRLVKYKRLAS